MSTTPWRRIEEVEVYLHAFMTPAIGGGEWSALPPGERAPGILWIGGWVGPRAGLDMGVKGNVPSKDTFL
jgi:hypothetical protein